MRLAGGGGRSASLTQVHVQEDRRLHAGWGPMAGEEGRLCSRSRVAGKRRGVEPWRGRGVVCGSENEVREGKRGGGLDGPWTYSCHSPLSPSPPWRPFYSGQLV